MPPEHVAWVISHPIQHFSPVFRILADDETMKFTAVYARINEEGWDEGFGQSFAWDIELTTGYSFETPSSTGVAASLALLHRMKPDVLVVSGWSTLVARVSILWALCCRKPILLYGDSTWQHRPKGLKRVLRTLLLHALFRVVSGAISTGTFNREFYISHGLDPRRISHGVYPFDANLYTRSGQPDQQRVAPPTLGYAGKLTPRKGVDELLRALSMVSSDVVWRAIVIGDGPARQDLEHLSKALGLQDRVTFGGFRNQSEMPRTLSEFDILVIPSHEDYRVLIAAEAMAMGAVVVASSGTAIWGEGDLLRGRETGFVYRSGRPGELAKLIEELLRNPEYRRRVQSEGQSVAASYGAEACAHSIRRSLAMLRLEGPEGLYLTRTDG